MQNEIEDVVVYCAMNNTTKLRLHTHDVKEIHVERFSPRYQHTMLCLSVKDAKKMRDWLDHMIKEEESKQQ